MATRGEASFRTSKKGGVSIELLGDRLLVEAFKLLDIKMQKKIARKGLRAGGKIVLAAVKAKVPTKSGKLKKSLKLRSIKRTRTGIGVYIRTGTRAELGISERAKGYYPFSQEYGTSKTPAHSYLRAALDEQRVKAIQEVRGTIWDELERTGRELAAKSRALK